MIEYRSAADGLVPSQLQGFFVGWPSPPSPERQLEILRGSYAVEVALDGEQVVGFATATSDGVLSAFIPLLEVLPEWQGRGIGTELMRRMFARLGALYMVDLCCDAELEPFYARLGMQILDRGMGIRNFAAAVLGTD